MEIQRIAAASASTHTDESENAAPPALAYIAAKIDKATTIDQAKSLYDIGIQAMDRYKAVINSLLSP